MTGVTEIFTLVWFLAGPVAPGGQPKDQTVYFGTRTTYGECNDMRRYLEKYTQAGSMTTESDLRCVPVPK